MGWIPSRQKTHQVDVTPQRISYSVIKAFPLLALNIALVLLCFLRLHLMTVTCFSWVTVFNVLRLSVYICTVFSKWLLLVIQLTTHLSTSTFLYNYMDIYKPESLGVDSIVDSLVRYIGWYTYYIHGTPGYRPLEMHGWGEDSTHLVLYVQHECYKLSSV